jgi:uracil-DNA glycosylase
VERVDVFQRISREIAADPMDEEYTQRGIQPLFRACEDARLVLVGQAPGRRAQETRLFWNDPSGDRLREWMGVTREQFYGSKYLAQLPMDFYFPGKGKSGDLPPRRGFAEKWHPRLLEAMPHVETIILVGSYSQAYYLSGRRKGTLTETVRHFREYLPGYLPLVHPSPRNTAWLMQNPWFERDVLPVLQDLTARLLEL